MADFRGEPLPVGEATKEIYRMVADMRRKITETLLELMEHQLNRGESVAEVFARARYTVETMHKEEIEDLK